MNPKPTCVALLSLSIVLALAACKPGTDSQAPAADTASAPTGDAPAAGDKVVASISGAGASFIFPLVSRWSADYNEIGRAHV